MNVHNEAIIV